MLIFKKIMFQINCNGLRYLPHFALYLFVLNDFVADVADGLQSICHIIGLWPSRLGECCRCVGGLLKFCLRKSNYIFKGRLLQIIRESYIFA